MMIIFIALLPNIKTGLYKNNTCINNNDNKWLSLLDPKKINTVLTARAVHVVYTRRPQNMERPTRSVVEKHEEFTVRRSETKS